MDRKLLIKVLGLLEQTYPGPCEVEKLIKILNLNLKGEFFKIIKYLRETNKIIMVLAESKHLEQRGYKVVPRDNLLPQDEISITPDGIDLLTKLSDIKTEESRNLSLTKATVVLALGVFIQSIIYFNQFSKEVNTLFNWLMLGVMGFILFIIFNLTWESFTDIQKYKKRV